MSLAKIGGTIIQTFLMYKQEIKLDTSHQDFTKELIVLIITKRMKGDVTNAHPATDFMIADCLKLNQG